MNKYIVSLFLMLATPVVFAESGMPAKQVTVRSAGFSSLGETNVTAEFAPSNSLQALLEWMDDNWQSETFSTNNSYYFIDGTTQSMWRATIRDYLFVDGDALINTNLYVGNDLIVSNNADVMGSVTVSNDITVGGTGTFNVVNTDTLNVSNNATIGGNLTVDGTLSYGSSTLTNIDMAVSFMGYPKITLTTNMVTVAQNGGTIIATNAFTSIFDADMTTGVIGTLGSDNNHSYEIDLGTNYNGIMAVKMSGTNTTNVSYSVSVGHTLQASDANDGAYSFTGVYAQRHSTKLGQDFNGYWLLPMSGRYLYISAAVGNLGSGNYYLYDVSFYGVTNAYANMGGF